MFQSHTSLSDPWSLHIVQLIGFHSENRCSRILLLLAFPHIFSSPSSFASPIHTSCKICNCSRTGLICSQTNHCRMSSQKHSGLVELSNCASKLRAWQSDANYKRWCRLQPHSFNSFLTGKLHGLQQFLERSPVHQSHTLHNPFSVLYTFPSQRSWANPRSTLPLQQQHHLFWPPIWLQGTPKATTLHAAPYLHVQHTVLNPTIPASYYSETLMLSFKRTSLILLERSRDQKTYHILAHKSQPPGIHQR